MRGSICKETKESLKEEKMPLKLKRIFQKEYGKKKGTNIFYAWENKRKVKGGKR
jgi:hypothetical protein